MPDTVTVNDRLYQVVPDLTTDQVAVALLTVVDEDGVTPVDITSLVSVTDPRFIALAKSGGLVVVMADPVVALSNPAAPPPFSLGLTIAGFRPVTVPVAVPPNPVLPVTLPPLILRRLPVALGGRAVLAADETPVAGATIAFAPNPVIPGRVLLPLGQALPADVPDGTALQAVSLTAVGGPVPTKAVQASLPAGSTWLTLDDRQGLSPGQILRIGPDNRPSLARIAVVSGVPADLTKPGIVLLATALTASARQGDPARAFTAGPPSATATTGAAFAGEALLLVTTVPSADALIVGPAATGIPFTAAPATDPDGYYRQPGIARFPRLDVTVTAAGLKPQTVPWMPAAGTTRIDWRMSP